MAYSEAQIADALAALKASGGNLMEASRNTGIDRATIRKWKKQILPGGDVDSVRRKVTDKTKTLADSLQTLAETLVAEALKPERIMDADYRDIVGGFKVAIDQVRNLRGQGEGATEGLDAFLSKTGGVDVE